MPASLTSLTGAMLATGSFNVRCAGSSPNPPELYIAAHYAREETTQGSKFWNSVRKFWNSVRIFSNSVPKFGILEFWNEIFFRKKGAILQPTPLQFDESFFPYREKKLTKWLVVPGSAVDILFHASSRLKGRP